MTNQYSMTDYGRQLFKQMEEQTVEAERLRQENSDLHKENRDLGDDNAKLHHPLDALEASLAQRIEAAEKTSAGVCPNA